MILQLFQQRVQSSRPLTFLTTPSNKRYTSQRLLTNATAICPPSKILFFQPSQARPFRRAAVYAYRDVTPCWPRRVSVSRTMRACNRTKYARGHMRERRNQLQCTGTMERRVSYKQCTRLPVKPAEKEGRNPSGCKHFRFPWNKTIFFFDFFVKKEHEDLGSELRTVRRMENRYQKLYNKFYTCQREIPSIVFSLKEIYNLFVQGIIKHPYLFPTTKLKLKIFPVEQISTIHKIYVFHVDPPWWTRFGAQMLSVIMYLRNIHLAQNETVGTNPHRQAHRPTFNPRKHRTRVHAHSSLVTLATKSFKGCPTIRILLLRASDLRVRVRSGVQSARNGWRGTLKIGARRGERSTRNRDQVSRMGTSRNRAIQSIHDSGILARLRKLNWNRLVPERDRNGAAQGEAGTDIAFARWSIHRGGWN